jgi:hypothetical protein
MYMALLSVQLGNSNFPIVPKLRPYSGDSLLQINKDANFSQIRGNGNSPLRKPETRAVLCPSCGTAMALGACSRISAYPLSTPPCPHYIYVLYYKSLLNIGALSLQGGVKSRVQTH